MARCRACGGAAEVRGAVTSRERARLVRDAAAFVQEGLEMEMPHVHPEFAEGVRTGLRAAVMRLMLFASRIEKERGQ